MKGPKNNELVRQMKMDNIRVSINITVAQGIAIAILTKKHKTKAMPVLWGILN